MKRRSVEILSLVLAISLAGAVAAMSWFQPDDLVVLQTARQMNLGWGYMRRELFDHVLPGHRLLTWLVAQGTPISWWSVVLMCVTFVALSAWGVRRFLVVEGVSTTTATIVACAVVVSGAWLCTAQWYSALAYQFPGAMISVMAGCALQQWTRTGHRSDLLKLMVAVSIGLMFDERVAIIAIMLMPLMWLLGHRNVMRLVGATVVTCVIVGSWFAWVALQRAIAMGGTRMNPHAAITYLLRAVFTSLVPSLVGWAVDLRLLDRDPAEIASVAGGLLMVLLIISWWRSPRGLLFFGWAVSLAVLAIAPVVRWRAGAMNLAPSPYESRYIVDIMPWIAISLTLSVKGFGWSKGVRPVLALLVLFWAMGVGLTTKHLLVGKSGDVARQFASKLASSGAKEIGYFDGFVPGAVVPPFFAPYNYLHGFVPLFANDMHLITDRTEGVAVSTSGWVGLVHLDLVALGGSTVVSRVNLDKCRQGVINSFTEEIVAPAQTNGFVNQVVLMGTFSPGESVTIRGWKGKEPFDITPDGQVFIVRDSTGVLVFPLWQDVEMIELVVDGSNAVCPLSVGVASVVPLG